MRYVSRDIHVSWPNLVKIGRWAAASCRKVISFCGQKPGCVGLVQAPHFDPTWLIVNKISWTLSSLDLSMCTKFYPDRLTFSGIIREKLIFSVPKWLQHNTIRYAVNYVSKINSVGVRVMRYKPRSHLRYGYHESRKQAPHSSSRALYSHSLDGTNSFSRLFLCSAILILTELSPKFTDIIVAPLLIYSERLVTTTLTNFPHRLILMRHKVTNRRTNQQTRLQTSKHDDATENNCTQLSWRLFVVTSRSCVEIIS